MRRKVQPKHEPVVEPGLLESAKRSLSMDRIKKPVKCSVCGSECSSFDSPAQDTEQLCWVCRRLKISAWGEIEQQMPAQE